VSSERSGMSITPVEIRHLQIKRGLGGYNRAAVDRALTEVADSFEVVWRERGDLANRIEELEKEVSRHAELEALLRSTLVSAERASQDIKEHARREAELIVTEARAEARTLMRDALGDKERLLNDVRRIQAMLRTALEIVDHDASAEIEALETAAEASVSDNADESPGGDDAAVRRLAG
jgi:cell division initiation protein